MKTQGTATSFSLNDFQTSVLERAIVVVSLTIICQSISISLGFLQNYYDPQIPWYWMWLHYCFAAFFGTVTHWLGHKHWSGRWFKGNFYLELIKSAHTIEHHTKLYPTKRFLNTLPLTATDGNRKYYAPTLLFPFVCTYVVYRNPTASIITGTSILIWAWLADEVHDLMHKSNHKLEELLVFKVLREMHFLHHTNDMLSNFGIFDFFVDFALGAGMLGSLGLSTASFKQSSKS